MSEQWITDEQIADARRSATAWSQYTPDNTRKAIEKAANHILELCDALDAQQAELAAARECIEQMRDIAPVMFEPELRAYDALRQGSGEGAGDEPDTDV